jgi:hypothetical protein
MSVRTPTAGRLDLRRHFIRLGPPRWWYAVAAMLWIGGFLGLFLYGYQVKTQRDTDAAGFQRAGLDQTVTVRVERTGRYAIWLESVVGADQPAAVRRLIDEAPVRRVLLRVTAADGRVVPVAASEGYQHRTNTGQAQVYGLAVGEIVLAPGEYRVTLAEPAKFAGDAGRGAGLAVGPLPSDPNIGVLAAGLLGAATGAGLGLLTLIRRQRATNRAGQAALSGRW